MLGAVLSAIWNGPFHIGQLERPVSLGDAVMKVLETAWRAALIGLAALVLFVGYLSYSEWAVDRREARDLTLIETRVSSFPADCSRDTPLMISFTNNSPRTVEYISYSIIGYEAGSLLPIPDSQYDSVSENRPIPAGLILETCRRLEGPINNAKRVEVKLRYAKFRD